MRKKNIRISYVVIIVILLLAAVYFVRAYAEIRVDFADINKSISEQTASQGNHIVYGEENGLRTFPFLMGGRVILKSLETGRKHIVAADQSFLGGLGAPAIIGNKVYYYKTWDGTLQGELFETDIRSKMSRSLGIEYIESYALDGHDIYYAQTDWDDIQYTYLYKKNLQKGKPELLLKVLDGGFEWIKILDGEILCYDGSNNTLYIGQPGKKHFMRYQLFGNSEDEGQEGILDVQRSSDHTYIIAAGDSGLVEYDTDTRRLKKLDELGDMWKAGYHYQLGLKDQYLYYSDKDYTVCRRSLKTGGKEKIIDFQEISGVKECLQDQDNLGLVILYCKDYIAVEFRYRGSYSTVKNKGGVLVFDYSGKLISESDNERLDL